MNRSIKVINILGTDYEIHCEPENNRAVSLNADGVCENYIKQIHIDDFEPSEKTVRNLEDYKNKVMRHELIHAFIHESGLDVCCDWARNEQMVDFFAIQLPKMFEAMKKLEVL